MVASEFNKALTPELDDGTHFRRAIYIFNAQRKWRHLDAQAMVPCDLGARGCLKEALQDDPNTRSSRLDHVRYHIDFVGSCCYWKQREYLQSRRRQFVKRSGMVHLSIKAAKILMAMRSVCCREVGGLAYG
jgi:hypothetical protein